MTTAKIIVLGNQKGGSGKSTTAMHVCVGLLRQGYKVAALDLDSKQGTLARQIENRTAYVKNHPDADVPLLSCEIIKESTLESRTDSNAEEAASIAAAITRLKPQVDVIVIDTPGTDNNLSRVGHTYADVLITPINDSLIDLDLLAKVDPETHKIIGPSVYSEMVWQQRKRRLMNAAQMGMTAKQADTKWIVMRNRLSHTMARNKKVMEALVSTLAERLRFDIAPGFGERVIFRELFLKGLTLLDLRETGEFQMSMSHIAARQEIRRLLKVIDMESLRGETLERVAA